MEPTVNDEVILPSWLDSEMDYKSGEVNHG